MLDAVAAHLYSALGQGTVLLVPEEGELQLGTIWPPDLELTPTDMTAARWAFEKNEPAGAGTATLPMSEWLFVPLATAGRTLGVVGVRFKDRLRT